MANLAIKGHATRGKEVIEILEMLSGKNTTNLHGECDNMIYIINSSYYGEITYMLYRTDGYVVFTLEEFLEKFPYKVGDKVLYHQTYAVINKMKWNGEEIEYVVECKKELWETTIFYLEPYKEESMEKEISSAIIDRFICLEGYDFYDDKGNIIDTKEIIMKKKQPKYPKTFVECAKILDCFCAAHIDGYYCGLLEDLQALLICRDAYWKLDGDWKPEYKEGANNNYYTIHTFNNKITLSATSHRNAILSFPTEEMRDAFYENFKKLIEECKELL
jgi:hypothetical protein